MNNIKHIHEVIFLIEKSDQSWTPEELIESIGNTWGEDVHFGSCSGNAFPKEDALDFLLVAGFKELHHRADHHLDDLAHAPVK